MVRKVKTWEKNIGFMTDLLLLSTFGLTPPPSKRFHTPSLPTYKSRDKGDHTDSFLICRTEILRGSCRRG